MQIDKLDIPYKKIGSFPKPESRIAEDFYGSISKQLNENFNNALDNDAFGNKQAYCYYRNSHMIHTLFNIIYFIY